MKVVMFNRNIKLEADILVANVQYVMSDFMLKQFQRRCVHTISSSEDLGDRYKPIDGSDLTGKKLLVWRTGGIGDLLFISPCLKELKRRYNGLKVKLACAHKYAPLWHNHELLYDGNSYDIPFRYELMEWADYHLHFEGVIETGGRAAYIHAVDLFAEYFKLNGDFLNDRKIPILPDVSDVKNKIKNIVSYGLKLKTNTVTVGWQFQASSPIRTFPIRRVAELSKRLADEFGWNVILFDSPGMANRIDDIVDTSNSQIYNAARIVKSIRETIALLKYVDIVVAPDSALTHIAGAMDIPTLAIYGPFPSSVRTSYYKKCIPLDATWGPPGQPSEMCTPCYKHGHNPCKYANADGESPCFSSIKNKLILHLLQRMASCDR